MLNIKLSCHLAQKDLTSVNKQQNLFIISSLFIAIEYEKIYESLNW